MFKVFNTGKKEYICKLTTRYLVSIEERLGENPVNALKIENDEEMPKLLPLLTVLYYSIKSDNPKLNFDDIYDIYDEYCMEGEGNIFALYGFIFDLLRECGLIFSEKSLDTTEEGEAEPKN